MTTPTTTLAPARTYEVAEYSGWPLVVYRVRRGEVLLGAIGREHACDRWMARRLDGTWRRGIDGRHRAADWLEARS